MSFFAKGHLSGYSFNDKILDELEQPKDGSSIFYISPNAKFYANIWNNLPKFIKYSEHPLRLGNPERIYHIYVVINELNKPTKLRNPYVLTRQLQIATLKLLKSMDLLHYSTRPSNVINRYGLLAYAQDCLAEEGWQYVPIYRNTEGGKE